MRSFQVFAAMTPERATELVASLKEKSPGMFAQALAAAAAAMRARPVYIARQPMEKQAAAIRRALARVSASPVAEELLAVYFLECRKELLIEWLDCAGVSHEDGTLADEAPAQPDPAALEQAIERFRSGDEPEERELLLGAFAAQSAVDWPELERRISLER
jgi:hypothetical protein